ncbi:MAG: amidohydrolase family protein, partial [Candidatus Heimdallarchaeota archaeon]|nr:amidohydrolase family protein [Candidatus Heimdallarchaeota archaeon]
GSGKPHPRTYGTYPRILGKYSRDQNVISFEEAIRKMTSYPAQTMGLKDRGIIREGTYADLVILNPETIIDTSDYMDPHQYPIGIEYVIVNGKIVVDQGKHTQRKPGMIITKDQSRF